MALKKLPDIPFGLFFKSFPKLLKSNIRFLHFDNCNLCSAVGVPWNVNYHIWVKLTSLSTSLFILSELCMSIPHVFLDTHQ